MSTGASEQTIARAQPRPRSPRRAIVALGALLACLALAACGGSSEDKVKEGTYAGEGGKGAPYLSVGPLVYQVQISRALNPHDTEDSAYLQGLSASHREVHPGEELFAVFMQVINQTGKSQTAASEVTIHDTEGHVYHPIESGKENLYAYRPNMTVPAKSQVPIPSSAAYSGPVNGLMLLYRIKLESLENRPLTVKIVSPTDPSDTASAILDS